MIKVTGTIGRLAPGSIHPVYGNIGYQYVKGSTQEVYPLHKYKGQFEFLPG